MIKRLKQAYKLTIIPMMMLLVMASGSYAGDLDPAAGPESTDSAMYTIEDLYNRLDNGTAVTKRAGAFTEPSGDPAAEGRTIDEVLGKMPAADNTNGATTGDVRSGTTFWGLRTDGTWGEQTGTSETCSTCTGTLSTAGRWCYQGDGTVKDMTTGLVWLASASYGGQQAFWAATAAGTNAHDRAAQLKNGTDLGPINLTDGSAEGDWRLPTRQELAAIATGTEPIWAWTGPEITETYQTFFIGIEANKYWSSTTLSSAPGADFAYRRDFTSDAAFPDGYELKTNTWYVWPVRSDY